MLHQFILNGIIAGSIYALIAIGFTVIYRTVRFFHIAHGVVYTIGAYLAYSLTRYLHLNFALSFFLSITFAAIFGMAIDRIVYHPLRVHKTPNLIYLLASFGVYIFLQNLISLVYGNQVFTLRTGAIKQGYMIFSAVITRVQITILSVAVILMILLWLFIMKTKLGKAMRAVSDDTIGASVVGINPDRIIMVAFAMGSALAGTAGILISLETNIQPTMGFSAILKGIIASIIGGIGNIPGAVFGGFLLGLAENLGIWKISTGWKDCIAFSILIIFLLIRPSGLLGVKSYRERM